MAALPKGAILIWYDSIATIPPGYILCDGANGTPDLRDRFIVGAGGAYPVDITGGGAIHNHAFTSNGHAHTLEPGTDVGIGDAYGQDTDNKTDSGITDNADGRPPYHALTYIMKT